MARSRNGKQHIIHASPKFGDAAPSGALSTCNFMRVLGWAVGCASSSISLYSNLPMALLSKLMSWSMGERSPWVTYLNVLYTRSRRDHHPCAFRLAKNSLFLGELLSSGMMRLPGSCTLAPAFHGTSVRPLGSSPSSLRRLLSALTPLPTPIES